MSLEKGTSTTRKELELMASKPLDRLSRFEKEVKNLAGGIPTDLDRLGKHIERLKVMLDATGGAGGIPTVSSDDIKRV